MTTDETSVEPDGMCQEREGQKDVETIPRDL